MSEHLVVRAGVIVEPRRLRLVSWPTEADTDPYDRIDDDTQRLNLVGVVMLLAIGMVLGALAWAVIP